MRYPNDRSGDVVVETGCAESLDEEALEQLNKQVMAGGAQRYHAANAARGKLFARERIAMLVDPDSFVEDGRFANVLADGLPADGVITGTGAFCLIELEVNEPDLYFDYAPEQAACFAEVIHAKVAGR